MLHFDDKSIFLTAACCGVIHVCKKEDRYGRQVDKFKLSPKSPGVSTIFLNRNAFMMHYIHPFCNPYVKTFLIQPSTCRSPDAEWIHSFHTVGTRCSKRCTIHRVCIHPYVRECLNSVYPLRFIIEKIVYTENAFIPRSTMSGSSNSAI